MNSIRRNTTIRLPIHLIEFSLLADFHDDLVLSDILININDLKHLTAFELETAVDRKDVFSLGQVESSRFTSFVLNGRIIANFENLNKGLEVLKIGLKATLLNLPKSEAAANSVLQTRSMALIPDALPLLRFAKNLRELELQHHYGYSAHSAHEHIEHLVHLLHLKVLTMDLRLLPSTAIEDACTPEGIITIIPHQIERLTLRGWLVRFPEEGWAFFGLTHLRELDIPFIAMGSTARRLPASLVLLSLTSPRKDDQRLGSLYWKVIVERHDLIVQLFWSRHDGLSLSSFHRNFFEKHWLPSHHHSTVPDSVHSSSQSQSQSQSNSQSQSDSHSRHASSSHAT